MQTIEEWKAEINNQFGQEGKNTRLVEMIYSTHTNVLAIAGQTSENFMNLANYLAALEQRLQHLEGNSNGQPVSLSNSTESGTEDSSA